MFLVTLQLNDYTNFSSCRIWEGRAFPSSSGSGFNLWGYRGVEEAQHAPALPGETQTNFWLGRSVICSFRNPWWVCGGAVMVNCTCWIEVWVKWKLVAELHEHVHLMNHPVSLYYTSKVIIGSHLSIRVEVEGDTHSLKKCKVMCSLRLWN